MMMDGRLLHALLERILIRKMRDTSVWLYKKLSKVR